MKNNTMVLDIVLNHIKAENKPISLVKQLGISKQLLSYYLRTLRLKGIIKKMGNGVWILVKDIPKDTSQKSIEIRNHAYIWKIRFINKVKNWENRINILKELKVPYEMVGRDKTTPRIIINNKKIWLTNEGMIIYEPKSFYDSSPISARIHAVYELQETINSIKSKLKINLTRWEFKPKREHIAKINDLLSIQCNKEGVKLQILDKGELWMEIDNSFNQDETEFYKTKSFSPIINGTGYQKYYNEHKDTNWEVSPKFILNAFAVSQNQLTQFSKQIESHLALIKQWKKSNEDWRKSESKKIKENLTNGKQTKIFDF